MRCKRNFPNKGEIINVKLEKKIHKMNSKLSENASYAVNVDSSFIIVEIQSVTWTRFDCSLWEHMKSNLSKCADFIYFIIH